MPKYVIEYTLEYPLRVIEGENAEDALFLYEEKLRNGELIPKTFNNHGYEIEKNPRVEYPIIETFSKCFATEEDE